MMDTETTATKPEGPEGGSISEEEAQRLSMAYPESIIKWELERHIVRREINGMVYIMCTDWEAFNRQLEEEKQNNYREQLKKRIAEAQAAAYLGEQERMNV